jgi:hypothetical protein
MQSLGDMTTWLPLPGIIAQIGSRASSTLSMAGYTDIFPKNEFCRTNAYGPINQALSLFRKTIFSWFIS